LVGNKEVKTNVAYFGGKYDFCKLHRADYDVITWRTCKKAAWGPLGHLTSHSKLLNYLQRPLQSHLQLKYYLLI